MAAAPADPADHRDGQPNGAQALFLIDGAEPGALDGYERCILLFDGRDEAAHGARAAPMEGVQGTRALRCPIGGRERNADGRSRHEAVGRFGAWP